MMSSCGRSPAGPQPESGAWLGGTCPAVPVESHDTHKDTHRTIYLCWVPKKFFLSHSITSEKSTSLQFVKNRFLIWLRARGRDWPRKDVMKTSSKSSQRGLSWKKGGSGGVSSREKMNTNKTYWEWPLSPRVRCRQSLQDMLVEGKRWSFKERPNVGDLVEWAG